MDAIVKNILDAQLRGERLSRYSIAIIVAALFLVMGYWFLPPLGQSSNVYGEVTDLRVHYGDGDKLFLTVRLDSNREVLVKIRRFATGCKKGERVKLLKMEPDGLGITEYNFQNCIAQ